MTRSPEQTFLRYEIGLFSRLLSRIQEKIVDKQLDVIFLLKYAAINKQRQRITAWLGFGLVIERADVLEQEV
jgi:hypothetical protein